MKRASTERWWTDIAPAIEALRQAVRSVNGSLLMRRGQRESYGSMLVTTDLEDAAVVVPALGLVDPSARIAVLAPYRIPYSGLHILTGKHRLERAIEQATRERLDAFARSSGIPGRLEQIVRRGDVDDCTTSELDARVYELFVLAVKHEDGSSRHIRRMIEQLLDTRACDLFIARESNTRSGGAELWPAVPW